MRKLLFLCLILSLTPITASSYEVNVHQGITAYTIGTSTMGQSLKDNLNISLSDSFNGKTVKQWMALGSKLEDDDPRWLNHFYDPTNGKGLNSAGIIIYGDPSLKWGKLALNSWDWESARGLYYSALTSSDRGVKENKFANVFRALGQIIHLVEDNAVPAHTRNDSHPYPPEWACTNCLQQERDMYEKFTRDAENGVGGLSRLIYAGYPAVDISIFNAFDAFWINAGKGLAEYTNRNFVSRDTNIDDNQYALPVATGSWIITERVYDPDYGWIYVDVKYLKAAALDNYRPESSASISRLSAFSFFDYEANKYLGKRVYSLNNYIYKEYADLLIPRAVGYSAGLLNYFFRGSIDISLPSSGLYSIADDRNVGFTRITLLAENNTANGDEMTDGSIELVARYRTVQQDPFQPADLQASNDYTYVVVPEVTGKRTIPRGTSAVLVFDRGQTATIPVNAVDVSLQVVYHGTLGNETEAVAVGMKAISDPTPVERVSNMDKICLDRQWYDVASEAAIKKVDPDKNGVPNWDIYPHDLANIFIKISPANDPVQASASDYTFTSTILHPRNLLRAFILGDSGSQINHSHTITIVKTTSADSFIHVDNIFDGIWPGTLLKSQIASSSETSVCNSYGFGAPCTIRLAPPFYAFRNFYMWGPTGAIFDNPKYPENTSCDWQALQ